MDSTPLQPLDPALDCTDHPMAPPVSATAQALSVPELVREVMSYLDQVSLYRAALVCRNWRIGAQIELFRAPELIKRYITEPERVTRTRLLVRTVTAAPALANMVKQLRYMIFPLELSSRENGVDELALQTKLLWLCPELDTLVVKGGGVPSQTSVRPIPMAALYAAQLKHLTAWGAHELAELAPYFAAFQQLTTLNFSNITCTPDTVTNWPTPTFTLNKLVASSRMHSIGENYPGLTEFDWLVGSSRSTLRHLELGGWRPDVLDDILQWGDHLETLHLKVGYWHDDELARAVDKLARMKALRRLQLMIGPDEGNDEFDQERYDEVMATVKEAVRKVNGELGREVGIVVG